MIFLTGTTPDLGSANNFALCWCVISVVIAAYCWGRTPFTRPGRPAISLTPEGVWLWPGGRHHTWLHWDTSPRLIGQLLYEEAIITTQIGLDRIVRFPMYCLPLGYTQLHNVLELFTTHPELRPALAHPEGLALVQTLMHTPLDQVEQRLKANGA